MHNGCVTMHSYDLDGLAKLSEINFKSKISPIMASPDEPIAITSHVDLASNRSEVIVLCKADIGRERHSQFVCLAAGFGDDKKNQTLLMPFITANQRLRQLPGTFSIRKELYCYIVDLRSGTY